MRWFRDINNILKGEPETWLTYLHGQQLENRPMLIQKKPRYRGLILQITKYGAMLLRDLRLKRSPELKRPVRFFIFAGTANQMDSLEQTIDSLYQSGEEIMAIGDPHVLLSDKSRVSRYIPYQLTIIDILQSLIFFTVRGLGLYRELRTKHTVTVDWYFANFCNVYTYLVYFYRLFSQVNPEFAITANDHNVRNRCMLAVAHYLDIKTVYLQHASVSPIFPALRVNYAFLDGQCALDIYRRCEPNQPDTVRDVPTPLVILSGQKKHLKRSDKHNKKIVGIALNALDDATAGIEFINALTDNGLDVRLRWHPGQADRETAQYRDAFSNSQRVSLSDPHREQLAEFMEYISWLIAGNSSIHLEAALAGVLPIYYELTPADQRDYYGYVKNGLTIPAESVAYVLELIKNPRYNQRPNIESVRYYSSTYLTEWESREGELVAKCLQNISEGKDLPVGAAIFGTEC